MEKKLISIIMSVYNAEKTIATCIDSIIYQDYQNWEFIICDDCSTDSTYNILKEYQSKDTRIKVIRNEKNSKLAFSLNHCLRYCSGVYVARMDDDDISMPNRLSEQVEFLNNHPEYHLVGSCAYVDDGINENSIKNVKEVPRKMDLLRGSPFMHPTIMIRKSTMDELAGYTVAWRTQRGQDLDLWFRLYSKGFKGYNIQEPLLVYRRSLTDFKKISFKNNLMYFLTMLYGYRLLKVPFYKYFFTIKPLLSVIIPNRIKMKYHKNQRDKLKND
ncbi:TPA: glycosyltransferase family 2 protein [Streptococcus suis]